MSPDRAWRLWNKAGLQVPRNGRQVKRLYGLGCGLVDIALLASTLLTSGASLWTLDRRLEKLATRFGVAYAPR